jgi:hypothetical protein
VCFVSVLLHARYRRRAESPANRTDNFRFVADYQQLTRKMVVEKFKQEEAERNALTPSSSRVSGVGYASGPEDVPVSA